MILHIVVIFVETLDKSEASRFGRALPPCWLQTATDVRVGGLACGHRMSLNFVKARLPKRLRQGNAQQKDVK